MTAADPTALAFLDAILDEPGEDVHRLAFADWLDEQGEEERAEFIRVQCRIAELEVESGHPKTTPLAWSCKCDVCEKAKPLRIRERELLGDRDDRGWFDGLEGYVLTTTPAKSWSENDTPFGVIRRGFVSHITLDLANYLQHAAGVFARHPVEEVTLSDKKPHQHYHNTVTWSVAGPGGNYEGPPWLPWELGDRLDGFLDGSSRHSKRYPYEGAASAALSTVLVHHGREQGRAFTALSRACVMQAHALARPLREARRRS